MSTAVEIKKDISWLKQHQTIVLTIVLALTFYLSIGKIESIMARSSETKYAIAAQQLADQKEADARLEKTVQALQDQYTHLQDQQAKEQALMLSAISQRNADLQKQQQKDQQLTPTELSNRWEGLIGQNGISVSGSSFVATPDAAIATVTTLEEVPVLKQNVETQQKIIASDEQIIAQGNQVISGQKDQITGLKAENKAQVEACSAQITEIKRKARVSKMKWFGYGFVTGAVSAVAAIIH